MTSSLEDADKPEHLPLLLQTLRLLSLYLSAHLLLFLIIFTAPYSYGQLETFVDFSSIHTTLEPSIKAFPSTQFSLGFDSPPDFKKTLQVHFVAVGEHASDTSLSLRLKGGQFMDTTLSSHSNQCFETSSQMVQCLTPSKRHTLTFSVQGDLSDVSLVIEPSAPLPQPWVVLVEEGLSTLPPIWMLTDGGLLKREDQHADLFSGKDASMAAILEAIQNQEDRELQERWEKTFADRLAAEQKRLNKEDYYNPRDTDRPNKKMMEQHLNQEVKRPGRISPEHSSGDDSIVRSPLEQLLKYQRLRYGGIELDLSQDDYDRIVLYIPPGKKATHPKV